jgi:hypothetical protein
LKRARGADRKISHFETMFALLFVVCVICKKTPETVLDLSDAEIPAAGDNVVVVVSPNFNLRCVNDNDDTKQGQRAEWLEKEANR